MKRIFTPPSFPLHILLVVIIMTGSIIALVISLMMIFLVIYKGKYCSIESHVCRKSDAWRILDDVPDDSIIQILIGRNIYEYERNRYPRGGDLRDNIPE